MHTLTEIANSAWSKIGAVKPDRQLRRWVRSNLSERDQITLATAWLRSELEKRERYETLREERNAERPKPSSAPTADRSEPDRLARDARAAQVRARITEIANTVHAAVEAHEATLDMTWTPDLLARPVHMPDGTVTTWGGMSSTQHRLRYEMFVEQGRASIEGAARHLRAIKDIEAFGGDSLDQIVTNRALSHAS